MNKLRVGTRGSELALIQTKLVTDALIAKQPGLEIEIVVISTKGDTDKITPIPLDTVGKAWFTSEIEHALAAGEIDLAVHSLKDMPVEQPSELELRYVLKRTAPNDALVSKSGLSFAALPPGAVIGTDSSRRRAQVHALRPDLEVRSLRGNVRPRLQKLHDQDYDAIILASAGLRRLGEMGRATEEFDVHKFIPSPGQGILAAEIRRNDHNLGNLLRRLEDSPTVVAATAERAFTQTVGGGCKLPIGCIATISSGKISIHAVISDVEGKRLVQDSASGPQLEATQLAIGLAKKLMEQCDFSYKH
jgi:hydroxymethylbilane synthase